MPLFQVAIVEDPTFEESKKGNLERVILQPQFIVAKDEEHAKLRTIADNAKLIPASSTTRVIVVPFADRHSAYSR
jgi:hypothetical protein